MKKLLVIGREGRLIKYAPEPDKLKEYDIVYAPVGARDEELLTKGKDADFILVDAIGSISANVIRQMANLKLIGFVRVFIYVFRIFLDLAARLGYPRCVRRGQVVLCFYFHFAGNRHFPFMLFVHFQGLFIIIHFTTPIYFFQELFSPTILLNTFSVSFVSLLSAM